MDRRTFLKQSSALGALAVAGCTEDATGGTETDSGTTPGSTPDETPDETPTEDVAIASSSIETTASDCASDEDARASVSMNESETTVTFSGLVTTGNPCHEATLAQTAYDADSDELTVEVGTEPGGEECVDCVGAVEFSGTVTFEGGLPGSATVVHDGEELSPGSGDDSADAPTLVEQSFSVLQEGVEGSTPRVERNDAEGTVVVTGTITGNNGCATAGLGSANYDASSDVLSVDVVTRTRDTDENVACTQALVQIAYEATFTFEGGLPGDVEVTHDGEPPEEEGVVQQPDQPTLADQSFRLTETAGSSSEEVDVAFNESEGTVVVTGSVTANDGCTTAKLGSASYDASSDELSVDVVTARREGTEGQVCTQAIRELRYEATFTFEGGLPSTASVSHNGQGVTSAGYGSATADAPETER